jgi:hypothetical protein
MQYNQLIIEDQSMKSRQVGDCHGGRPPPRNDKNSRMLYLEVKQKGKGV